MNFNRQKWRWKQFRKWRQRNYKICLMVKVFLFLFILLFFVGRIYGFSNLRETKEISTEKITTEIAKVEAEKIEMKSTDEPKSYENKKEESKKKTKIYKKVEKLIAKHTIKYPGAKYDANRNKNLSLAATTINKATGGKKGYVLNPGEKFSWLEIIGDPNEEKGYQKAGILNHGEAALDYGGGVCQVSSTIYSAISKTDQATDKKHLYAKKHSKPSKYIKPERGDKEATVTYSGKIDFWFVSTLEYPIRIFIKTGEGTVTVKIFEIKEVPIEEVE